MNTFGVLWSGWQKRYWAVSDKSGYELSDDTVKAIRGVLVRRKENLSDEKTESLVLDIKRACWMSLTVEMPVLPSAIRNELEALKKSLDGLFAAMQGMSYDAVYALWQTARLDSQDNELANYGEAIGPEFEFTELRRRANLIERAIELTLESMEVPKKSHPYKIRARHLAFHVAVALEQVGISPTSYDQGTYLQILGYVFEEVLPEDDYLRAGRWALKYDLLEENFLN